MRRLGPLLTLLLLLSWPATAVERVVVSGLFADRALLVIDGQRRLLRSGETSPEGVTLVESDARRAILEIDGRRGEYRLGVEVSGIVPAEVRSVRVLLGPDGLFSAAGSVNGSPVSFVVDTGANAVALNAADARAAGIDAASGRPVRVRTASGPSQGHEVVIDEVAVGSITLRQVQAVVLDGADPVRPLLGMSFLGRIELVNKQSLLELHQR